VAKADYATASDFSRIFQEDQSSLYLLAFLLTANHQQAEECLVAGIEDAANGNPVFRAWARSWSKRTLIKNAIQLVLSGNDTIHQQPDAWSKTQSEAGELIDAVAALPLRERFERAEGYYATVFHELVHSTGHEKRLNRSTLMESAGFGSNPYCKEELIAEMGAAFLCGEAEIAERTINNSAAYLKGWLEQLRHDKMLIVQAAAQANGEPEDVQGASHDHVIATIAPAFDVLGNRITNSSPP